MCVFVLVREEAMCVLIDLVFFYSCGLRFKQEVMNLKREMWVESVENVAIFKVQNVIF